MSTKHTPMKDWGNRLMSNLEKGDRSSVWIDKKDERNFAEHSVGFISGADQHLFNQTLNRHYNRILSERLAGSVARHLSTLQHPNPIQD